MHRRTILHEHALQKSKALLVEGKLRWLRLGARNTEDSLRDERRRHSCSLRSSGRFPLAKASFEII